MKISTIIVDDEALSRRGIEIRLLSAPDFEVVAQFGSCECQNLAIQRGQLPLFSDREAEEIGVRYLLVAKQLFFHAFDRFSEPDVHRPELMPGKTRQSSEHQDRFIHFGRPLQESRI